MNFIGSSQSISPFSPMASDFTQAMPEWIMPIKLS